MSTIPQLADLKRRLYDLNMKKARYGISAEPSINIEAQDLETVISQMGLIDIHRRNVSQLLKQANALGQHTPPHIQNQIISERASIQQRRQTCARLGQHVPAHPVDDDEEPEPPPVPAPSIPRQAPVDIRAKLDQIEQLIEEIRAALR